MGGCASRVNILVWKAFGMVPGTAYGIEVLVAATTAAVATASWKTASKSSVQSGRGAGTAWECRKICISPERNSQEPIMT